MIDSPVIAAGILGSAGMLLWASVALVPLLLHLWNRHQHQETPWAAMEFLLAAVEQHARRLRVEQLLLLLLRMAIPVILALALADPIWEWIPALGSSPGARPPHHHVLVFDNSYSMGYRVDGKTRLDHARQLAQDIVEFSEQGDGFTLLTMAEPAQVVVGSPVFSAEDVGAEISGLGLQDTVSDLASSLDLVSQTLVAVSKNYPRLEKHRIYFFSDLGVNTWQATSNPEVRQRIGKIAEQAEIVTIDVGVDNARNTIVSDVVRENSTTTLMEPASWRVTLEDVTGDAQGSKSVTLTVDGQLASRQTVQLPSGKQASTVFAHQFDSPGEHHVEFRLDDDALPVDNRHQEIVNVREVLRVLCVEGKPGAARNVALALSPNAEDPSIQTRVTLEHRISDYNLADYDCVFLCNVSRFTASRVTQLRDYLKLGRSVVLFLGDQVKADNYNEMLANQRDGAPLLPVMLGPLTPADSYFFDPQDYRHPIIRPFRGQERAGLLTTPIWRYVRLELPQGSPAEVVLAFSNGDPAIIEHRAERGRIILVATAASEQSVGRVDGRLTPWTAWTAWPSFPPLIHEVLAEAVSAADENSNRLVGDSIGATLPAGATSRFVSLAQTIDGQEQTHRVPVIDSQGAASWFFDRTFHAGRYTATLMDDDLPAANFALNLRASDESRLERFPASELPDQFRKYSMVAATGDSVFDTASTPLFRMLLGLLLVLMMLESYFAWFLGNLRA